jgi:hypothetical protein
MDQGLSVHKESGENGEGGGKKIVGGVGPSSALTRPALTIRRTSIA